MEIKLEKNKIIVGNGYLKYTKLNHYSIDEIKGNDEEIEKLVTLLLLITSNDEFDYVNNSEVSLLNHHFMDLEGLEALPYNSFTIKRFTKIGNYEIGEKNNICDVLGVRVGEFTIHDGVYNTGVTVISPHEGNIFRDKCVCSSYSFNGFGKSIGLVQVEELGTLETNITLTTTLNVGKLADGVVSNALEENPEIGETTGTVNPVVMECNDGTLNKSRDRILGRKSYYDALEDLDYTFRQGDVGAGSGMTCHGFKGGIGSSSRKVKIGDKEYTIGILVNSNFGESNGHDLVFNNRPLGEKIKAYDELLDEKGSIIGVLATDAPINERQIKRLLKRMEIGIGRTGSYAGNGSGDVFIGFTTANKRKHFPEEPISNTLYLSDNYINSLFKATVDATTEAVLNSMLFSHHLKGYKKEVKSLLEYSELFIDLLDGEILWDKEKKDMN